MDKKQNLCIFTHFGVTYSFKNTEIITNNETVLVFAYIAMSDGISKEVVFYKDNIIGFSTHWVEN